MLSFRIYHNTDAVVIGFMKAIGSGVNSKKIFQELDKHPDYPSMLAISDVLTNFKIGNSAFKPPPEDLHLLRCPFITHSNAEEFVVVNSIEKNNIVTTGDKRTRKLETQEFTRYYTGAVLVAEQAGKTPLNTRPGLPPRPLQRLLSR